MESTTVNWTVLDTLVLDYADAEQLLDDVNENSAGKFETRQGIQRIRKLIEEGCITEALDLIRQRAPSVLENQRLLFRLHKQKFVELLRCGRADARLQAIQCSRTVLGPCALNAYPEAYEEFKRILLALIYNKDDESSPVAQEWSELRRAELAATVASVLKAQLHAYDPIFLLTLRYLLSTHNSFCCRQGVASPIAQIADMVLVKEKDPPATPQECLLEAPKFSESDVQALAHAVELPRQGAVDSLRYTGGDLVTAFKNELSRLRLNINLVDELVREYCVYRGLVECNATSIVNKGTPSDGVVSELSCSRENDAKEVSNDTVSGLIELVCEAETMNTPESIKSRECDDSGTLSGMLHQDITMEPFPDASNESGLHATPDNIITIHGNRTVNSLCSTSGSSALLKELKNRVGRRKEGSVFLCRKWNGRYGHSQTTQLQNSPAVVPHGDLATPKLLDHGEGKEVKITIVEEKQPQELDTEKYRLVLEIRELASEGMTSAVIEEVNCLNPGFFEHNPHLLFKLKQVEFLKLVEAGDYTQALGVARADMGPLAAKYPDLLKPLKETILALARPHDDILVKPPSPFMLGVALQVALSASLGIAEPSLMKIMKATLHTHTEWFKLQMCSDPFGEILRINALKETELSSLGNSSYHSKQDSTNGISSRVTGSTGNTRPSEGSTSQQLDSSREGVLFDEIAILTVMEWMALPRGDAIQLLAQYDGNVDNVFAHILS